MLNIINILFPGDLGGKSVTLSGPRFILISGDLGRKSVTLSPSLAQDYRTWAAKVSPSRPGFLNLGRKSVTLFPGDLGRKSVTLSGPRFILICGDLGRKSVTLSPSLAQDYRTWAAKVSPSPDPYL